MIRHTITIARPVEDVFLALTTNIENVEKWFPARAKEWWTSAPPHGVGSTRRARVTMGWFTTENDAVVAVYEPPHRAVLKGTSPNAPFVATLAFEQVEGGTRVDGTIEMFLRGPARLFGGAFERWYGKSWGRGLVRLKQLMESGEL